MERIKLILGDITRLKADAIVNAANNALLGGGGVDGAIHMAAGPGLLEACRKLNGCETGNAKITGGFNLAAGFVIHTVGPVWHGGNKGENNLLASCYRRSLELASARHLNSIAFPNISTGVYGFPKEKAGKIAITTVRKFLSESDSPETVIFCVFDPENYSIYKNLLSSDSLSAKVKSED
jgi:O-acetyl-ADP-ribose deacetylase